MFGTRSYIIVTFAFLFWLYYVASGGGVFEPEQWPEGPVARVEPAPTPEPEPVEPAEAEPQITEAPLPSEETDATTAPDQAAILDALTEAALSPDQSGAGLDSAFSFTEPVAPLEIAPEAITAAPAPAVELVRIAGNRVNIRSGPGTEYAVVVTLDGGTVIEALSITDSGWIEIRLPDGGGIGWVSATLVEPAAQ
jgi:outer membrane receptor protein involved in Fe transport